MWSNLAKRLEKERLEKRLAGLKKDYQDLGRDYEEADDSDQKNRLKSKLNRKLEEITEIEKEIKRIEESEQREQKQKLIEILQSYLDQQLTLIKRAYEISLPKRASNFNKFTDNPEKIISDFRFFSEINNNYYLEKFVCNLWLLSKDIAVIFKEDLEKWIKDNIKERRSELIQQLEKENEERQQCNPGLLVVITNKLDSYVVEAWLIKNIDQYNQGCYSACQHLEINNQVQITTDINLTNVPEIIKIFIQKSFEKYDRKLKEIQIFLPYKLMNHRVDCWQDWQQDEDDGNKTIGECYQVVIRCSERLTGKNRKIANWRDKGERLNNSLNNPAKEVFILCDSEKETNLEEELKLKKEEDDIIAVQIITVFQQEQPGKVLWILGVPLALWIRQQLPSIDRELDNVLTNCHLQELPRKVKRKRIEAKCHNLPENHVGRHLCLLWDNPNLLPPEQLLTENKL